VTATWATVGSGSAQETRPNSDVSLGLWTDKSGGTSNIYQSIDEATANDNTDYITSTSTATNPKYKMTVASQSQPSDHSETKIKVRARQTGGSRPDLIVRIFYGNQSFKKTIKDLTTTWTTRTIALTEEESEALGWGTDFTVELEKKTTAGAQEIWVTWLQIESASGAGSAKIYNAYMETPEAYGVDLSYTEFEVPDTTTYTQPDNIIVYAGNEGDLYLVENTGFTVKSKAGGYATGTVEPMSWSFVSWGDDVVATNYEDPVQLFDTSVGGLFADLITEPASNPPQARFCAVVGQFLVLANITNRSGYGEYSVWWSAINDPAKFYEGDLTTQSDYQHLRDTAGSITGIVGGDNGLIFKANAIYQMVYVGPPLLFAFHLLARGQGTSYPRSIVSVGQDVYFLGNGGFYVLRGGMQLEAIGDGAITKMFLDAAYGEARAMVPEDTESVIAKDGHVVGAYDPFSGLIFWSYKGDGVSALENDMVLIYNPKEGRWSWCGPLSSLGLDTSAPVAGATWSSAISAMISIPALHNPQQSILKTLGFFEWDPTGDVVTYKKASSAQPYDCVLKTKILSTAYIMQTESFIGQDHYLRSVKPVIRGEPNTTDPEVEIVVSSSDDILMLAANTNTETLTIQDRNSDGWYTLTDRLEGEFWQFEAKIHSSLGNNTENIMGLLLDMEVGGEV
jgi:hypothetical protein